MIKVLISVTDSFLTRDDHELALGDQLSNALLNATFDCWFRACAFQPPPDELAESLLHNCRNWGHRTAFVKQWGRATCMLTRQLVRKLLSLSFSLSLSPPPTPYFLLSSGITCTSNRFVCNPPRSNVNGTNLMVYYFCCFSSSSSSSSSPRPLVFVLVLVMFFSLSFFFFSFFS